MEPIIQLTDAHRKSIEEFRSRHKTGLLVLLFTDVVDSTAIKQQLGDVTGASLLQKHNQVVRDLLREFPEADEISTAGDSFFIVFVRPSDAVRFALLLHPRLKSASEGAPRSLMVRVGIHMGEVLIIEEAATQKRRDILGTQVDTASRIMSLAQGGQTLMSRSVFDNARHVLRGDVVQGLGAISWASHGPYIMKGVEEPVEVCEAAEEGRAALEAPARSEKAKPVDVADDVPGWRPGLGAVLPGANWAMEAKLGEGGFGEVWLAHDRANATRKTVFKFCTKRNKVQSLRRELDVFNHLCGEKGKTPPGIVEVLGAHDEEPPYYIQLEFVPGGDLKRWLDERGKDAPLRVRLDLAVQMARALARVHQAGFVHRDVKPSNYLVDPAEDPVRAPALKLSDFGIGQEALDAALGGGQMERLSGGGARYTIHSQTLAQAAGTYFFIAPELVRSGSTTPGRVAKGAQTAADVYSLGVSLYQLFAGDSETVPGPGLRGLQDPVLREDIEACLEENPEKRPSAEEVARRIERYDDRRAAAAAAEKDRLQKQRNRARRIIAAISALLLVAVVGVIATIILYGRSEKARDGMEDELYRSNLLLADSSRLTDGGIQAREILWRIPEEKRQWEWGFLLNQVHPHVLSLDGHLDTVRSAQFSSDGQRIVTASSDKTAKVWNAVTGKELFSLAGHLSSVWCALFSPDGRRIVTASDDTARVWDGETGKELFSLAGHSGELTSAQFSQDGRRIVTTSQDKTAKAWDAETGKELFSLAGHLFAVRSAQFSPDGRRIVTASSDKTAKVWDTETGKEALSLEGHSSAVWDAQFSPDGRRIVTVSSDNTAKVWDVDTGKELFFVVITDSGITHIASGVRSARFSPDGRHLVTASDGTMAVVWDAETGKKIDDLPGYEGGLAVDALYSPDGQLIMWLSSEKKVTVWNPETRRALFYLAGHAGNVTSAQFSPDGRRIVTASTDGTAKVWDTESFLVDYQKRLFYGLFNRNKRRIVMASKVLDVETGRALFSIERRSGNIISNSGQIISLGGIINADFSPDGQRIVISDSVLTKAAVLDAETGDELISLTGHKAGVWDVRFSLDGRRIVTASDDKTAKVWDAESGKELHCLAGHSNWVLSAEFSPDAQRIVTTSEDKTAKVWDIETGKELFSLGGHTGSVIRAQFSPEGRRIVTASSDKTAKVWDAETGKEVFSLAGHTGAVWSAQFSPDGLRIVTASLDKTAKVWDAERGKELLSLPEYSDDLKSAWFSQDGRSIVMVSDGKIAKVWEAAPWRKEDLPGDASMSWQDRFTLWRIKQSNKKAQQRYSSTIQAALVHDNGETSFPLDVAYTEIRNWEWGFLKRIWSGVAARQSGSLDCGGETATQVVFSPKGDRVVTALVDGTIPLWDVATSKTIRAFGRPGVAAWNACFDASGRRLAAAFRDGAVWVWDVDSGRKLCAIEGEKATHYNLVFTPSGERLFTHMQDSTAKVWNAETGALVSAMRGEGTPAQGVVGLDARFSPDGKHTAITFRESSNCAYIVETDTGKTVHRLEGHTGPVWKVEYDPEGKRVATFSMDGTAKIWDATTGKDIRTLRGHAAAVQKGRFSPDGRLLATCSSDRTIRVWSTETGDCLTVLRGHTDAVWHAQFTPDGRHVLSYSTDGTVRGWDWEAERCLFTIPAAKNIDILEEGILRPDGLQIALPDPGRNVTLWSLDWEAGAPFALEKNPVQTWLGDKSSDGSRRVALPDKSAVQVQNASTGAEAAKLSGFGAWDLCKARLNPDGRRVVTVSTDGAVRIWDVEAQEYLMLLPRGKSSGRATDAAFSPDGFDLVVTREDGQFEVWQGAPWRKEDLPGDDSMTWQDRFTLWKNQRAAPRR